MKCAICDSEKITVYKVKVENSNIKIIFKCSSCGKLQKTVYLANEIVQINEQVYINTNKGLQLMEI